MGARDVQSGCYRNFVGLEFRSEIAHVKWVETLAVSSSTWLDVNVFLAGNFGFWTHMAHFRELVRNGRNGRTNLCTPPSTPRSKAWIFREGLYKRKAIVNMKRNGDSNNRITIIKILVHHLMMTITLSSKPNFNPHVTLLLPCKGDRPFRNMLIG